MATCANGSVFFCTSSMPTGLPGRCAPGVGADGARDREQDNGEGDEDTEHHAEGIEELGI
jgi:hypothetical protein